MTTVYRLTDRVPVQIGDVLIKLGPYSYEQKIKLLNLSRQASGEHLEDMARVSFYAFKYSVKGIEGLSYLDGDSFRLEFTDEKERELTDECLEELMGLGLSGKLLNACMALINGIPTEIIDSTTGLPLEGIKILPVESGKKK